MDNIADIVESCLGSIELDIAPDGEVLLVETSSKTQKTPSSVDEVDEILNGNTGNSSHCLSEIYTKPVGGVLQLDFTSNARTFCTATENEKEVTSCLSAGELFIKPDVEVLILKPMPHTQTSPASTDDKDANPYNKEEKLSTEKFVEPVYSSSKLSIDSEKEVLPPKSTSNNHKTSSIGTYYKGKELSKENTTYSCHSSNDPNVEVLQLDSTPNTQTFYKVLNERQKDIVHSYESSEDLNIKCGTTFVPFKLYGKKRLQIQVDLGINEDEVDELWEMPASEAPHEIIPVPYEKESQEFDKELQNESSERKQNSKKSPKTRFKRKREMRSIAKVCLDKKKPLVIPREQYSPTFSKKKSLDNSSQKISYEVKCQESGVKGRDESFKQELSWDEEDCWDITEDLKQTREEYSPKFSNEKSLDNSLTKISYRVQCQESDVNPRNESSEEEMWDDDDCLDKTKDLTIPQKQYSPTFSKKKSLDDISPNISVQMECQVSGVKRQNVSSERELCCNEDENRSPNISYEVDCQESDLNSRNGSSEEEMWDDDDCLDKTKGLTIPQKQSSLTFSKKKSRDDRSLNISNQMKSQVSGVNPGNESSEEEMWDDDDCSDKTKVSLIPQKQCSSTFSKKNSLNDRSSNISNQLECQVSGVKRQNVSSEQKLCDDFLYKAEGLTIPREENSSTFTKKNYLDDALPNSIDGDQKRLRFFSKKTSYNKNLRPDLNITVKQIAGRKGQHKNSKSNSHSTRFPKDEIITLGIVPLNFPHEIWSDEQLQLIRSAVLDKIVELKKGSIKPQFTGCYYQTGWLVLKCIGVHSANWIRVYVPLLKLWTGAAIQIISENQFPKSGIFIGYFREEPETPTEKILSLIEGQNEQLSVKLWKVLGRTYRCSKVELTMLLDPASSAIIRQKRCTISYGFKTAALRLTKYNYYKNIMTSTDSQFPDMSFNIFCDQDERFSKADSDSDIPIDYMSYPITKDMKYKWTQHDSNQWSEKTIKLNHDSGLINWKDPRLKSQRLSRQRHDKSALANYSEDSSFYDRDKALYSYAQTIPLNYSISYPVTSACQNNWSNQNPKQFTTEPINMTQSSIYQNLQYTSLKNRNDPRLKYQFRNEDSFNVSCFTTHEYTSLNKEAGFF